MGTTVTATTTDLPTPVIELLDRSAIEALVHHVGACLDEARFDDLRPILTADASASTPGGVADGVDAVVVQAARNHSPDEHIQHAITDVVIDLDGDEAAVRANLVVTFGSADGGAVIRRMGGVYRFGARRTVEGWRLTRIATVPVWREGAFPVPVPVPAPEPAPG
jgi:hypothetical protein